MPLRLPRPRVTRARLITSGVVLVLAVALVGWAVVPTPASYTTTEAMIPVQTGPAGNETVTLDTTLYLPRAAGADNPVPAILLAHGFGGTKQSVAQDARDFADRGYAVLTWTAQGMGRSTGEIHLNSPDYEIRDAQRLLDWLAARTDIQRDGSGDPRVGVVGGSYGGALALMLAGQDQRVDAIVPMITWNDLANAFLPESTGAGPDQGVFKKQWAGLFFGRGGSSSIADAVGAAVAGAGVANGSGDAASILPGGLDPACGRFAKDVCDAYLDVATTGHATPGTIDLLRRSSPAPILNKITAPTLLIQGQADSLFPLSEAEANYRGIAATGTAVRMDWFSGGHDGGEGPQADRDRLRFLTITWLDHYLMNKGDEPGTGFTFSRVSGFDPDTRRITTTGFKTDEFPDRAGGQPVGISLTGPPQQIANPPDGNPAAITTLPGAGSFSSALQGVALEIPGQNAIFYSQPLETNTDVVGTPTVQIRAASPTGEAVLFVKLYDLDPDSGATLPFGLTAPVRLTGLPTTLEDATPVTVTLPGIVHRFEARPPAPADDRHLRPGIHDAGRAGGVHGGAGRPVDVGAPADPYRGADRQPERHLALPAGRGDRAGGAGHSHRPGSRQGQAAAQHGGRRGGVRGHPARGTWAAQGVRGRVCRGGERRLHRPSWTSGGPART